MAHYLSNHVAVAYGDIFDEMVALSQELGFQGARARREQRERTQRRDGDRFYLGIDVGTGSARAGSSTQAASAAGMGVAADPRSSGPRRTSSSSRPTTSGARAARACARRSPRRGVAPDERSRASASTRPARWSRSTRRTRPVTREPDGRRRAERDRLDGPPRHRSGRAHQRSAATRCCATWAA